MIKIIKGMDKTLLVLSVILFSLGLIMIYSASNVTAFMQYDASPSRYFVKELVFIIVGMIFAMIFITIPTKRYSKLSWLASIAIGGIIIALTLLGQVVNGMSGWINYNGLGIQPSEFAKIAIIPLIASFYDNNKKQRDNFWKMMTPMIVSALIALTIVFQGDFGTTIIFLGLCALMFFFSPVAKKIKVKIFAIGLGLLLVLGLIVLVGGDKVIPKEKLERFNYKDPCARYVTTGNQLCNGYIAINGGGLGGKGLGNSTQKYLYLPEAHTDFVFAIFVEEAGMIGATVLLICYFLLIVRIIVVGKRAKNITGVLICYGVAFYIFMHIMVNLTGVLGILPMTGVPLPFISYGGSICFCIIASLTMVQRVAYESSIEPRKLKKS